MKNYFECTDGKLDFIISFKNIVLISRNNNKTVINYNGGYIESLISEEVHERLVVNYKFWLDSQSNQSEIQTSCSCSDKANDSNHIEDKLEMVLTREQIIKIIENIDCEICENHTRNYDFVKCVTVMTK